MSLPGDFGHFLVYSFSTIGLNNFFLEVFGVTYLKIKNEGVKEMTEWVKYFLCRCEWRCLSEDRLVTQWRVMDREVGSSCGRVYSRTINIDNKN